jgi:hypothetical protein
MQRKLVYVDEETHRLLKEMAKADGRQIMTFLRLLLEEELKRFPEKYRGIEVGK